MISNRNCSLKSYFKFLRLTGQVNGLQQTVTISRSLLSLVICSLFKVTTLNLLGLVNNQFNQRKNKTIV